MVNTLKLPNNYRLIEEEEMMYTEGKGIPRDWAAWGIDVSLAVLGYAWVNKSRKFIQSAVDIIGKNRIAKMIVNGLARVGQRISESFVLSTVNLIGAFFSFSVGNAVAHALDWSDRNYNGWIF